jgi:transcription termination factor Rho
MSPEELRKIRVLHNYLQDLNSFEIIKFIKEKFEKFKTNDVFLSVMNK